ncbi:MAG: MBOAT family O-acyltransferase [Myxococcota bacterium]|nr:MBOAT family protein [Myxococcales bacterium]
MIFSNLEFFVFFAVFAPLYVATQGRLRAQNALTLAASYVFYGYWDVRFLSLVVVSTVIDFVTGLAIAERPFGARDFALPALVLFGLALGLVASGVPDATLVLGLSALFFAALVALDVATRRAAPALRRRTFFWASVTTNLGILATFKYFNFFAESFVDLAGALGFAPDRVTIDVILPVGISFYTFQSMSYTIDVWRGQLAPTRDFVRFATYVSFFPQLVAGPIERASHLLPQFGRARVLSWAQAREGAMLFLWGFYKKVVIADNLGPIADRVFAAPAGASPGETLAGVLAFTFQIYGDFSGYSDMARGLARMLGFDLMVNFDMPYFARTPSEFWRRWHISLSSWLRDYLYIPLGGNRGGEARRDRNLMATMLLGGLWHGAAWTFVAWGAFHGAIQVVYRRAGVDAWLERTSPRTPTGALAHAAAALGMFGLAVVGWVLFRARSFGDAAWVLGHMAFVPSTPELATVAFYAGPLVAMELAARLSGRLTLWDRTPFLVRLHVVLFALSASAFLAAARGQAFIYFDF